MFDGNIYLYISGESGQNYRELSHALGFLPDIVTVRTLLDNGYMSDGIGKLLYKSKKYYIVNKFALFLFAIAFKFNIIK